MKIVMINGSFRKNGATARILKEMSRQLKEYGDADIEMIHVADLELKYCTGCCNCYKTGECIYKDGMEKISDALDGADGIIFGSPTYASNVSGQMKVIIERGHFIMEQSLQGKYAISVATYENHGGRAAANILSRMFTYSGAKVSGMIVAKNEFNSDPLESHRLQKKIHKSVCNLHSDVLKQHRYLFQSMKHFLIFQIGIRPFVLKKGAQYEGVMKYWEKKMMK